MKHRIGMTKEIMMPIAVAYEVEFDDETGEADVVSAGRVTQFRESLSRREIVEHMQMDQLDAEAYQRLVETEALPRPKEGDVVVLSRQKCMLSYDEDLFDPNDATVEELVNHLFPAQEVPKSAGYKKRKRRQVVKA